MLSQALCSTSDCGLAQELVRINAPRVHNEWRQKMRAAKLEELKAEVKIMMENHEHAVECRDSIIQVKKFLASLKPAMMQGFAVCPINAGLCLHAFFDAQVRSGHSIFGLLQAQRSGLVSAVWLESVVAMAVIGPGAGRSRGAACASIPRSHALHGRPPAITCRSIHFHAATL